MKKVKFTNPFKSLKARDYVIWSVSAIINTVAFGLTGWKDPLTFISAIFGVTALIFNAKGHVNGQIISVVFAIFYSIVAYFFRYYSELITYAFMTAPIAILTIIAWLKNPYGDSGQVSVATLTKKKIALMCVLTAIVTVSFFFILRALDTPNLAVSTLSIATSFIACYLMLIRSPWFAIAFSANDIVLIVLWTLATVKDIAYLPMVTCFSTFLINDVYSFICWCKMKKSQNIENSVSDESLKSDGSELEAQDANRDTN